MLGYTNGPALAQGELERDALYSCNRQKPPLKQKRLVRGTLQII